MTTFTGLTSILEPYTSSLIDWSGISPIQLEKAVAPYLSSRLVVMSGIALTMFLLKPMTPCIGLVFLIVKVALPCFFYYALWDLVSTVLLGKKCYDSAYAEMQAYRAEHGIEGITLQKATSYVLYMEGIMQQDRNRLPNGEKDYVFKCINHIAADDKECAWIDADAAYRFRQEMQTRQERCSFLWRQLIG